MSQVTQILGQIEAGDSSAGAKLLPLVYEELRKLATASLARERPGQTLQATALVHEAYLRLMDDDSCRHWNGQRHFFGAAAEAMRRILIENARKKQGPKAGGHHERVELLDVAVTIDAPNLDLIALNESLEKLQAHDPRAAEVVKLRFFAGLTRDEAADVIGMSVRTLDDDWEYAKAWLKADLKDFASE